MSLNWQLKHQNLADRFLNYTVELAGFLNAFNTSYRNRHITGQLFRSGSSAGANYQEACGAISRADFIHRMTIVLKELRESHYWLQVMLKCELFSEQNQVYIHLLQETESLMKITAKSIITAKKGLSKK